MIIVVEKLTILKIIMKINMNFKNENRIGHKFKYSFQ